MSGAQAGQVAVVTGGTSGVGHAFATALAQRGMTVVLMSRTQARGEAACAAVRRVAPQAALRVAAADLSDLEATRAAVARVRADHPVVHVVGTMAGVFDPSGARSADGHELHLATNVLSAWQTVCGLRQSLLAAAPSRVVLLSGNLHLKAGFDADDLALGAVRPLAAAKGTMLYKALIAAALARRCEPSAVTFNAACPGFTRSRLLRNLPWYQRALASLATPFAHSAARGAEMAVALATDAAYAGVSGRYFRNGAERAANPVARDAAAQSALLAYLAETTGSDWPAG